MTGLVCLCIIQTTLASGYGGQESGDAGRIRLNLGLNVPPITVKMPGMDLPQVSIGASLVDKPNGAQQYGGDSGYGGGYQGGADQYSASSSLKRVENRHGEPSPSSYGSPQSPFAYAPNAYPQQLSYQSRHTFSPLESNQPHSNSMPHEYMPHVHENAPRPNPMSGAHHHVAHYGQGSPSLHSNQPNHGYSAPHSQVPLYKGQNSAPVHKRPLGPAFNVPPQHGHHPGAAGYIPSQQHGPEMVQSYNLAQQQSQQPSSAYGAAGLQANRESASAYNVPIRHGREMSSEYHEAHQPHMSMYNIRSPHNMESASAFNSPPQHRAPAYNQIAPTNSESSYNREMSAYGERPHTRGESSSAYHNEPHSNYQFGPFSGSSSNLTPEKAPTNEESFEDYFSQAMSMIHEEDLGKAYNAAPRMAIKNEYEFGSAGFGQAQ